MTKEKKRGGAREGTGPKREVSDGGKHRQVSLMLDETAIRIFNAGGKRMASQRARLAARLLDDYFKSGGD